MTPRADTGLMSSLSPLPGLEMILPDTQERRRYQTWLNRLCMREFSAWRLARRAKLEHRMSTIRDALHADPRFERIEKNGPDCFRLRVEHRHTHALSTER